MASSEPGPPLQEIRTDKIDGIIGKAQNPRKVKRDGKMGVHPSRDFRAMVIRC
jgi:hypothetical protein